MTDPRETVTVSPLAAIREKERALQQAIKTARERADQHVAEARARADAIKEQAEREGLRDAETFYSEGIARARAEAESLRKKGERDATSAIQISRAHISLAVEYIVRFVLPRTDA